MRGRGDRRARGGHAARARRPPWPAGRGTRPGCRRRTPPRPGRAHWRAHARRRSCRRRPRSPAGPAETCAARAPRVFAPARSLPGGSGAHPGPSGGGRPYTPAGAGRRGPCQVPRMPRRGGPRPPRRRPTGRSQRCRSQRSRSPRGRCRRRPPGRAGVVAGLVLVAERQVDADEGLLLLLVEIGIGEDLAGQVGLARSRRRGCRPARRASRPRCAGPWRSAGGSPPRDGAAPARSGSGRDWRCPPAPTAGAATAAAWSVARG